MKMTAVDARLAALESRRLEPGLTVAEQSELRDCEITLGMTMAGPKERAEASRRVERFAAERDVQDATLSALLDATVTAARAGHAPKLSLHGNAQLAALRQWADQHRFAVESSRRTGILPDGYAQWELAEVELSGGGRISAFGDHEPCGGGR